MIAAIRAALKARKIKRLQARLAHAGKRYDHHRAEATRIATLAYETDEMAQPLLWGRLQHSANIQFMIAQSYSSQCEHLHRDLDKLTQP